MKETKIEERAKVINKPKKEPEKFMKILLAEVLEEGLYRYSAVSNVPLVINEVLEL